MSILTAEFDLDVAKRVWADERALEIAENMLEKGYTVKAIAEITGSRSFTTTEYKRLYSLELRFAVLKMLLHTLSKRQTSFGQA